MDEQDCSLSPNAQGILKCLQALAQEAASLNLLRTLSAIEDALEAAADESGMDGLNEGMGFERARPVLH
jgi:hypothetical protein